MAHRHREPIEDEATVIESGEYQTTVEKLAKDPAIRALASAVPIADPGYSGFMAMHTHGGDVSRPTHEFMMTALHAYHENGGKLGCHIGGPAQAILAIVKAAHVASLRPMYDEATVTELARDLSEQIILTSWPQQDASAAYTGMARKLYAAGWRKPDREDWITDVEEEEPYAKPLPNPVPEPLATAIRDADWTENKG